VCDCLSVLSKHQLEDSGNDDVYAYVQSHFSYVQSHDKFYIDFSYVQSQM